MASGPYTKALQAFASGQIDLTSDDIVIVLVDTGAYTVNLATHEFLDDVAAGARIGTSDPLTGKTVTDGVFDANDAEVSGVAAAENVDALLVVQDSGDPATSRLIGYVDDAPEFPLLTTGGVITVAFDGGVKKIFRFIAG